MGDVHMVVVGDNNVGKTSLCITFSTGQFPSLFTPMECNRVPHEKDITLGSETIHVKCTDTEGNEDMDATRPESYTGADVFLLCFSVKGPTSFQNIKTKWIPELKQHAPNVPILLVGCKEDTRKGNDPNKEIIKKGQGKKMKSKIGAAGYVECSALKKYGVEECFLEAVKVATGKSSSKDGCSCTIL
ncbi:rho-related GTP-binding protein RhoA-B-like [Ruditapes philippinarum]|uniref:rho-related GTP-binding protein RhoA-B-like n=1 Tax=Ruditapes philippinarum TaxID=129788 RepID=UPI00295B13E9|nr:rho-related GTP-binding protein RhoA-B-like [Ruditapes philippinarum]